MRKRMLTLAEARAVLEPEFAKAREQGRAEARAALEDELKKARAAVREAGSQAFDKGRAQGFADGLAQGRTEAQACKSRNGGQLEGTRLRGNIDGFNHATKMIVQALTKVHKSREDVALLQTRLHKRLPQAMLAVYRGLQAIGLDIDTWGGDENTPLGKLLTDFWDAAEEELLELVTKQINEDAKDELKKLRLHGAEKTMLGEMLENDYDSISAGAPC